MLQLKRKVIIMLQLHLEIENITDGACINCGTSGLKTSQMAHVSIVSVAVATNRERKKSLKICAGFEPGYLCMEAYYFTIELALG